MIGFLVALVVYAAIAVLGWVLAGTGGVFAAVLVALLIERRLAAHRARTPANQLRKASRAHR